MPYTLYSRVTKNPNDSIGQSWTNETIDETRFLCNKQTLCNFFSKHLPLSGNLLEAGCGLGRWVFFLKERGYLINGLEISHNAISAISSVEHDANFIRGDVLTLPYRDNSLDAVISLGVVEHFPQGPQKALIEMKRVLKSGGKIIISVPFASLLRRFFVHPLFELKRFFTSSTRNQYTFSEYRYSLSEFERILNDAGFVIIDCTWDELKPPLSIGLYSDFNILRKSGHKWRLNRFGLLINYLFSAISLKIHAGGVCYCCAKP
jgi:SAM-dependent methyltransferase